MSSGELLLSLEQKSLMTSYAPVENALGAAVAVNLLAATTARKSGLQEVRRSGGNLSQAETPPGLLLLFNALGRHAVNRHYEEPRWTRLVPERVPSAPPPPARRSTRRTTAPHRRCARGSATRCSPRSPLPQRHTVPRGGIRDTRPRHIALQRQRTRIVHHPFATRPAARRPGCGASAQRPACMLAGARFRRSVDAPAVRPGA